MNSMIFTLILQLVLVAGVALNSPPNKCKRLQLLLVPLQMLLLHVASMALTLTSLCHYTDKIQLSVQQETKL